MPDLIGLAGKHSCYEEFLVFPAGDDFALRWLQWLSPQVLRLAHLDDEQPDNEHAPSASASKGVWNVALSGEEGVRCGFVLQSHDKVGRRFPLMLFTAPAPFPTIGVMRRLATWASSLRAPACAPTAPPWLGIDAEDPRAAAKRLFRAFRQATERATGQAAGKAAEQTVAAHAAVAAEAGADAALRRSATDFHQALLPGPETAPLYAYQALALAKEKQASQAKDEATVALQCPIRSVGDALMWMRFAQGFHSEKTGSVRWVAFWPAQGLASVQREGLGDAERASSKTSAIGAPSASMFLSFGWPPPAQLAWLGGLSLGSQNLWPLKTERTAGLERALVFWQARCGAALPRPEQSLRAYWQAIGWSEALNETCKGGVPCPGSPQSGSPRGWQHSSSVSGSQRETHGESQREPKNEPQSEPRKGQRTGGAL